jgi:hypothetical protein
VFNGTLFAVEDFDGTIPPTQMEFDKAAFWVRMFNLPLACMGRDLGIQLGGTVGEVEEVDTNDEGVAWGEFLRVRIRISLTKPIARGRVINLKGLSIKIPFQYERLPKICFQCGVICHGGPVCSISGRGRVHGIIEEPQYGPWLRVSSNPRRPFTGYEGQRGEDEQSGVQVRKGSTAAWEKEDSRKSEASRSVSEAHSSERVNPGNRAVTKIPGGKVNADVQTAVTNGLGGKVNADVLDKSSGAIYADTDHGIPVLRGKLQYGRKEEVGINGEIEVATANEELTKEVKGQQEKGDSVDIGQHKMGDLELNRQHEKGDLAPVMEKNVEEFNKGNSVDELGKGIDVSNSGSYKMGSGGNQGGMLKKSARLANKKRLSRSTTKKASKSFLKEKDVGPVRPTVAEVAALFAQQIKVQQEDEGGRKRARGDYNVEEPNSQGSANKQLKQAEVVKDGEGFNPDRKAVAASQRRLSP